MKTSLIKTIFLILLTGATFAQNEVQYTYDAAGNRIKREANSTQLNLNEDNNRLEEKENNIIGGVELTAHPNPTSADTEITISIDKETIDEETKLDLSEGVIVQLVDINGKILHKKEGKEMSYEVKLEDLASGLYLIKLFTLNGQLIGERKVLKE